MKYLRLFLWVAVLGTCATLLVYWALSKDMARMSTAGTSGSPAISGEFTLTDQNGQTVTSEDFNGQWRLVFFGFTYCPEICPTTLAKMTRIMKELGPQAENVQPLFISVDTERDTPQRLKDYLADYHPKIVGLTGSEAQLQEVADNFKVYYGKIENPDMPEMVMFNHSTYMYLFRPDGSFDTLFSYTDTIPDILETLNSKLSS